MDLFSFPPIAAALDAAYSTLLWIVGVLEPIAGGAAAVIAVILITLLVRAALIPVGVSQAKAEQTRARLAPKLRQLQTRYKNDRERLQRETVKLYADENASPLAGCLPLLIQAPIVGIIYTLFLHPAIAGHANGLLAHQLLGVPLGASAVGLIGAHAVTGGAVLVFATLVGAIAVVAEVTRRRLRPPAPSSVEPAAPGVAIMTRMAGVLQFTTAVFALFVPLAAGIYLLVTVAWTLGQRLVLRRRYPLDVPARP
ncbi:MAG: membrane protein insertase YidC [Microbacterium sp.]|nr:membrane protein insertase YidC [Microbacterium sp.]